MATLSELKLEIPSDELDAVVHKSILDALTPEARERILAEALSWVTKPTDRNSLWTGKRSSPLQEAFYQAINISMQKLVREWIENDEEVKGKVTGHLRKILLPFLDDLSGPDAEELQRTVMSAVIKHIADKKAREY